MEDMKDLFLEEDLLEETVSDEVKEYYERVPITSIKESRGIITQINSRRGFGFILDESGKEIFFNASGVISPKFDDIREGYRVKYSVVSAEKGPKAIGIYAL